MDLARNNLLYCNSEISAANFSGLVNVYSSYTLFSSFKIFATKFQNFGDGAILLRKICLAS